MGMLGQACFSGNVRLAGLAATVARLMGCFFRHDLAKHLGLQFLSNTPQNTRGSLKQFLTTVQQFNSSASCAYVG